MRSSNRRVKIVHAGAGNGRAPSGAPWFRLRSEPRVDAARAGTSRLWLLRRSVVVVEVLAELPFGVGILGASGQLEDVEAGSVPIDDVDIAAIVDLDVVGHVAVGIGVVVRFRHVERHLVRRLWL